MALLLRRRAKLALAILILVMMMASILIVKRHYSYGDEHSLLTTSSDINKRDAATSLVIESRSDTTTTVDNNDPEYGYDVIPLDRVIHKSEAICQKTGNKEPIKCTPLDPPPSKSIGAPPAYRSCIMVKRLEKSRFFRFQIAMMIIGLLIQDCYVGNEYYNSLSTLLLVYWRRHRLQQFFQRKITRRIAQV
ncbi:hypothetical protein BDF22DRAFT_702774 [Syncephalis plumigaleata]|nr:hypothetical protein BDF22DRAFT_702774 [Syncephalis plumigaleata]